MKLGILGGTFDPVHVGHVAAAAAAMECGRLGRVLFVPSFQPPHRPACVASAPQRLEMCRLAVQDDPRFEVSDIEVRRPGPSYTVDTLRSLRAERPADELTLILGWDAARLFCTWHRPDEVLALAQVIVIGRPGLATPSHEDLSAAGIPESAIWCPAATPDVAASALREAIAAGRSIAGEVPAAVAAFISANGLYGR